MGRKRKGQATDDGLPKRGRGQPASYRSEYGTSKDLVSVNVMMPADLVEHMDAAIEAMKGRETRGGKILKRADLVRAGVDAMIREAIG
jgi:hypothetical protein